jgi:signal transduction histidine kinase
VVAVSIASTAVLSVGFVVARAAHSDLLAVRRLIHEAIVDDFVASGLLPLGPDQEQMAKLDAAVRLRLLGGETVRVKLWGVDGEILYSDAAELIGRHFEVEDPVAAAFAGASSTVIDDISELENATERDFSGRLLEHYMPVTIEGKVVAAFEIYELADSFEASLAEIRSHVWQAVGLGLAALLVAFGSLVFRHARSLNQRRADAESLASQLITAADQERRRIVGALHDDVGQPLYRIQYGLEGSILHVKEPSLKAELERLLALVAEIDLSLRSELRILHSGLVEGDDLADALARLGSASAAEGKLEVRVRGENVPGVSGVAATVLFQATQEAVINARKHAQASLITIVLRATNGSATVIVEDNGKGWNGKLGIGLVTTGQRIRALDGTMQIERNGARGTRVAMAVPAGTGS